MSAMPDEALRVPLLGLRCRPFRAFDPRQEVLARAATRAGLIVIQRDAVYVYVEGFTMAVCDALRRQRLSFHVTVELQEERRPHGALTRA